ncbi:MAG: hypothetical protein M3442_19595 [Chloroflexota bacterium]|nr:hypothetical protein [Chloroflexota bacterium]
MNTSDRRASDAVDTSGGLDELAALYPPGHPPEERRSGYIDDTLDAYPPYHLLRGTPSPEALAAAREKAVERRLIAPDTSPAALVRSDRATRPKRAAEVAKPARK